MTEKPTKTGKELERRVAHAYREIGARKVEHDVELAGNQIDVYVELGTPGRLLHRIAVEVKDWSKPVGIDVVNGFAVVAGLLRARGLIDEGVIVSALGFSKQARNAAETHGIRLLELADLDAMIKEAAASMTSAGLAEDHAQAVSPSQHTEYRYDVFISYSHADQEWVQNELLPRLEQAGIEVIIDYRDFEPGAPLMTEMERAVLESRKTVLVLTPAYLNSEWTEIENILVQTLDPGARRRRLLPVVLQPCEIPLRIKSLVYIDLSQSQLDGVQFRRLLEALAPEAKDATSFSELPESGPHRDRASRSGVPEGARGVTADLDERVVLILYTYYQQHPGDPKMGLNELIGASRARRSEILECLYALKEKQWLEYDLTVGAVRGLVWLTPLGIRVAVDVSVSWKLTTA